MAFRDFPFPEGTPLFPDRRESGSTSFVLWRLCFELDQ